MYKVKVLSVGKNKETWLTDALHEYEKRLTPVASIEWVFVKTDAELAIKEPYIALDPNGELLDSPKWGRKILSLGSRLTFIIGGADGLSKEILQNAKLTLSLSPLTFTHQMTRLILIEQLYRAFEIEKGSQYHK